MGIYSKPLGSCLDIRHKAYRITPPTPGAAPCFAAWFPKLRLAELIALSSLGRPAKKHLTICLRGIESRNNRHEKYIAIGPRWIPFQRSGTPEFRPGPVSLVESPFAGRNHGQRAVRPGRARAGASTPDPTATAPNEPRSPTVARPWRIAVKPAAPHQSSSDGPKDHRRPGCPACVAEGV